MDEQPILLVEDDEIDVMAVQRLCRKGRVSNTLLHVSDGEAALALLRGDDVPERPLRPLLVLLDLKMSPMGGIELLEALNDEGSLPELPVVVLSGAKQPAEIARCQELGARDYLQKPLTLEELHRVTAKIGLKWTLGEEL